VQRGCHGFLLCYLRIKTVCLFNFIEVETLLPTLSSSLSLSSFVYRFLKDLLWMTSRDGWFRFPYCFLHFPKEVYHARSRYHYLFLLAGYWYRSGFPPIRYQSRYCLPEISYAGIYDGVRVSWGWFSTKS